MKKLIAVLMLTLIPINSYGGVDLVKVNKSDKKIYLMEGDIVIREYKAAFGAKPKGHKEQVGDEKTPEVDTS